MVSRRAQSRILVAGGGIGGLATAIALGRRGHAVSVLERSSFADESGAGIQLGPNATRALRTLGIFQAIERAAFRPEAIWIFDAISGRRLATVPLGPSLEQRYGAPYLTLHRADLHAALIEACEGPGSVSLRPGFTVTSIVQNDREVSAESPDGEEIGGACLIGADGLWSRVRELVAPGTSPLFTGATAWRTLLDREALPSPFDAPVVGLWLGPRAHLVHYPVRGGRELNLVAVVESGEAREGWSLAGDPRAFLARCSDWSNDSKSLLERPTRWRGWSLYRLPPLRHWSLGRIALLGDAAHPALPYLAQGAALAIEDAVTLSDCLEQTAEPADAFRSYQASRQRRTGRVQSKSRRLGRFYHLHGAGRLIRNAVLSRRRPDALLASLAWLYRAD